MIYIPAWITNIIFLLAFYISLWEHVKMRRPNPVTNIQFFMMVFAPVMVLVVTFNNRKIPYISLGFFAVSVICLIVIYRQWRYLPPSRQWD
jgi:hypothetical protein